MKKILVYQDYIHNNGVLFQRLQETFGDGCVSYCDADDILGGCLTPAVGLFVMPGGADLNYCEKLNGAGNRAIRAFVEQGGVYFGICAGAYYACRRIEWAKEDGPDAICGPRELGFFAGTAIGPLYELLEDRDLRKSWNNVAMLITAQGVSPALYNAGPRFAADPDSAHEILAAYRLPGAPAALLSVAVGKGRAVLSGCHIEFTPETFNRSLYLRRNPSAAWAAAVKQRLTDLWTPEPDLWDKFVPGLLDQSGGNRPALLLQASHVQHS